MKTELMGSRYSNSPPLGSVYTPNPLPSATSAGPPASSSSPSSSTSSPPPSSTPSTATPPPPSSSIPTSSSPSTTTTPSSTSPTTPPTCAPTPATNLVQNGGFECGIAPWIPTDIIHTTHSLTPPAAADNSLSAYQFTQSGPVDPSTDSNPASVNQDISPLTVGRPYVLTFRSYFAAPCGNGFVGVMLNHQPVYTVDACDYRAGVYNDNTVDFVAAAASENLRFEFLAGDVGMIMRIDNGMVSVFSFYLFSFFLLSSSGQVSPIALFDSSRFFYCLLSTSRCVFCCGMLIRTVLQWLWSPPLHLHRS
ncbi:hypothetical protein BDR22DRAFT_214586 [Usnea florida]